MFQEVLSNFNIRLTIEYGLQIEKISWTLLVFSCLYTSVCSSINSHLLRSKAWVLRVLWTRVKLGPACKINPKGKVKKKVPNNFSLRCGLVTQLLCNQRMSEKPQIGRRKPENTRESKAQGLPAWFWCLVLDGNNMVK